MSFSRRNFLRSVAGATIALPFLESLSVAAVSSAKRFVALSTFNGVPKTAWRPTGGETGFTLGSILQPLEAHRDYLTILDGLDNRAANCGGHDTSTVSLLTGRPVASVQPAVSSGISIDQLIANTISTGTRVKSVQLGVRSGPSSGRYISFAGAGVTLPAENDPLAVYTRVFGGGVNGVDPATVAALKLLRQRRQAVLDGAKDEIDALKKRISSADKQRLDSHLESIREVERALDSESAPVTCTDPGKPGSLDIFLNANFPTILDLQTKLLVYALRCDLTRVASLMWSESTGAIPFTWLGIATEAHELSHRCGIDPDYVKVCTWYSTKFADLLKQLRDPLFVDSAGKTILDNTMVMWVNELSSCVHDATDIPVVLAGKGGNPAWKTNRFIDYGTTNGCPNYGAGAPLNALYVSMANLMGNNITTFGDPSYGSGPLSKLV